MHVDLGPFRLLRPAGRGAMAHVWRAVHRGSGTPVAVKVVTAEMADAQLFRDRFAAEVRAVARLDHPGVVRLHDHGQVPTAGLPPIEGLPPGAPYLVMEWIDGGTLVSRRGRLAWPALRATLLGLLDTLAHAHARGIVHRDLKPANVLCAERGPVLTDFGVAFAAGDPDAPVEPDGRGMVGTPNYMAPEQIRGDWRSTGPHTDLYALGCMAYALVCGRAPHGRRPIPSILEAHLRGEWPALRPLVAVPVGFEQWIARLAARRASARFALAADAAIALMALPEHAGVPAIAGALPTPEDDATVVAPPVFVPVDDVAWRSGPRPGGRPPLPASWVAPPRPAPPPPLAGVGRSLFTLRPAPLVARHAERDALWGALRGAIETPEPRVVLVRGASGLGKTRLVEWLAERASSLGAALPIRVNHGRMPGSDLGLSAAVRRLFRCGGLDAAATLRRIERGLAAAGAEPDVDLARSIAAAMDRDGRFDADGIRLQLGSPRERYAAIASALCRVAAVRPRLLLVDDGQWGADALAFVEHVLDLPERPPVLMAVVVRDDALIAGSAEADAIARIEGRRQAAVLRLAPLDAEAQARLLSARLPLAPTVLDRLVERTAGNPLFGETLVRHWIQCDALESTADGFRPRDGAETTLPDGLRSVWWARVRRVLAGLERGADEVLELAATLGVSVDPDEWRAACLSAGLPPPRLLAERLLDDHLMRAEDERLVFAHAMLRETLVQRAKSRGRFAAHNAICAGILAARGAPDPERRARFLLAANRPTEALPLLMMAIDGHLGRSEYLAARRAMVRAMKALRAGGQPRGAPPWAALAVRWSRMCRIVGQPKAALRHARRATRSAVPRLRVRGRLVEGIALMGLGDMVGAWPVMQQAVADARGVGDADLLALALSRAGNSLIWLGRFAEADALLTEALAIGTDAWPLADARLSMAELLRRRRRPGPAARHGRKALAMYRAAGSRWGLAQAWMILGDIDRNLDCTEQARAAYTEARRLCRAVGSREGMLLADVREALALLGLDRFAEARAMFEAVGREADARMASLVAACLLTVHAAAGDWPAFDRAWARLDQAADGRLTDPDIVDCARRAAGLARAAGQGSRAADALALADRQARALGWLDAESDR